MLPYDEFDPTEDGKVDLSKAFSQNVEERNAYEKKINRYLKHNGKDIHVIPDYDIPGGKYSFVKFEVGKRAKTEYGWKLHISVDETDLAKAWEIMNALLIEHEIASAKVLRKNKVLSESKNPRRGQPEGYQRGKQFTIYASKQPPNKPVDWQAFMDKATQNFIAAGIKPSYLPKDSMPVDGSAFFSYRNDKNHKGEYYEPIGDTIAREVYICPSLGDAEKQQLLKTCPFKDCQINVPNQPVPPEWIPPPRQYQQPLSHKHRSPDVSMHRKASKARQTKQTMAQRFETSFQNYNGNTHKRQAEKVAKTMRVMHEQGTSMQDIKAYLEGVKAGHEKLGIKSTNDFMKLLDKCINSIDQPTLRTGPRR